MALSMEATDLTRALDRVAARNLKAASLLGIPGIFAAAIWLQDAIDRRALVLIVAVGTVSSFLNWTGARKFLATDQSRYLHLSQASTVVISSACAMFSLLGLIASTSSEEQLKVVIVSITILASAASANSASRTLMMLFSGPLTLGLTIGLIVGRADPFLFIGVVVFLFISDRSYRMTRADTARVLREKARADDLSEQLSVALAAMERESLHDPLTGAGNRRMLERCAGPTGNGARRTVICIDLDHFKQLNDQHGHEVGDELLVIATERITSVLRAEDTLIRIGGDEFVAIINAGPEEGRAVAKRILRAMSVSYPLSSGHAYLGASIGISAVEPDETIENAQRRADHAMYQAKLSGRNRLAEWESDLTETGPIARAALFPTDSTDVQRKRTDSMHTSN
jgi:diguanylate cyclase (GGDEF)-like protein